jgi:hypothetical protein
MSPLIAFEPVSLASWNPFVVAGMLLYGGIILYFYYRKEQRKIDDYFGVERALTATERAVVAANKRRYRPIDADARLPSATKDGWALVDVAWDATETAFESPLPSADEISALRPGDLVKLKFRGPDGGIERLWVEYRRADRGLLRGVLRNDAFGPAALRSDQPIWFHPNHVLLLQRSSARQP